MNIDYSQDFSEFEVAINGNSKSMLEQNILSIVIDESLEGAATFSFTVAEDYDVNQQQVVWFDKSFLAGSKISIKMGYAGRLGEILQDGIIERVTTTAFTGSSSPKLTVTGSSSSKNWLNQQHNLGHGTTNQTITGTQLIDIIEAKFGLKKVVENTTEIPTRITQNATQTYMNILTDQAQNIGWEFFLSRGTLYYINPKTQRKTSNSFVWGRDMISFIPTVDTSHLASEITARSSSPTSSEPNIGQARQGTEEALETGTTASDVAARMGQGNREEIIPSLTPEEAEIRDRAALNRQGDNLLNCDAEIIGNPDLEIGQIVQLDGLGKRFSGKYFVTKVRNTISPKGYVTFFTVRKNTIN